MVYAPQEAPGTKATSSLLHVHLATQEARRGRSAEAREDRGGGVSCSHGKIMEKMWENHGKIIGKTRNNHGI